MTENTVYFFKLSVSNFKTQTIPKSLLYIEFVNNLCTIFGPNILVILCPCVANLDNKFTFT